MKNIDSIVDVFNACVGEDERLIRVIRIHLDLILKWQKIVNLIGVTSEKDIAELLYLDSFFAIKNVFEFIKRMNFNIGEIADIGSGAGFPSLFWYYFLPDVRIILFEGKRKKANFLMEFIREAGLKNYEVREEMVVAGMLRTDLIISKAAININDWARFGISNVKGGGIVVSLLAKGSLAVYKRALERTPMILESYIDEYVLPITNTNRWLGIIVKK